MHKLCLIMHVTNTTLLSTVWAGWVKGILRKVGKVQKPHELCMIYAWSMPNDKCPKTPYIWVRLSWDRPM